MQVDVSALMDASRVAAASPSKLPPSVPMMLGEGGTPHSNQAPPLRDDQSQVSKDGRGTFSGRKGRAHVICTHTHRSLCRLFGLPPRSHLLTSFLSSISSSLRPIKFLRLLLSRSQHRIRSLRLSPFPPFLLLLSPPRILSLRLYPRLLLGAEVNQRRRIYPAIFGR